MRYPSCILWFGLSFWIFAAMTGVRARDSIPRILCSFGFFIKWR